MIAASSASSLLRTALRPSARAFSSSAVANRKVAVLGAAGGIGQPDTQVTDLRLYDIRLAPGVAADVGHVNTPAKVTGYAPDGPEGGLEAALKDVEIIVIPAGVPRKPGMTRDDLFNTNASIVRDLAKAAAKVAPKAHLLVISNPVNSTVPIVAEVFKKAGVYDPKRLFGVTTLDVTRASTFLSGIAGAKPADVNVPVVGGHSGVTIVPLLSQVAQGSSVSAGEQYEKLVHRIQFGGDEVVKAKDGAGSATLSMAYAAAVFSGNLIRALNGEKGVVECTYVEQSNSELPEFFASRVELGPNGVEKIHGLGETSAEEKKLLEACIPQLKKDIAKGVEWVKANP
ncbi:hypothetical protein A4X09_0g460 [Tilletia walkeri]|uniref:Malate dehydrogenase n=1 Tax=Tilletia walkeri TaxID=117179 RepID=A0A8X7NDE7_9BASI|nr:hypothetical protein A4X09_0g460 [Tilletia walkeri]